MDLNLIADLHNVHPTWALGWAMIADLALKAFRGFAAGKAQQNQGKAINTANKAAYGAQKANYDAGEQRRGAGYDAASALLGNVQGSLGNGAPNYQIDPATLERMKAPRPYAGSMPADATAGSTWALLGGLAGGAGDALGNYQMGQMLKPATGTVDGYVDYGRDDSPGQSVNRPVGSTGTPFGSSSFGGGDDRQRVCALNPRLPGCGGGGE